jgi:hypothetical protein
MLQTLLAATTALTLMSGVGLAQSSSSTSSTTVMTPGIPPTHDVEITTTTKRTATKNGVLIEKDTSGDETISPGRAAATQTTTESTTSHN